MKTNLVTIPTDTIPLDGAWYEPEAGVTAGAVLLFHGNTMNFYVGGLAMPASPSTAAATTFSASETAGLPKAPLFNPFLNP